jgi:hypothetical protein
MMQTRKRLRTESRRKYGKASISLIEGDTKKLTVDTKIHRLCMNTSL